MMVRRFLYAHGYRYRLHRRDLPGRPDIVLPKHHAAVFVHGCFWHAHEGCKYFRIPSTRREFWEAKLLGNRDRDRRQAAALAAGGWRVATIWECGLREGSASLEALAGWLVSDVSSLEVPHH